MATSTDQPEQPLLSLTVNPLKLIDKLPEFSGEANELFNFIDLVDNIIPEIAKYDQPSQVVMLNYLKNKLKGKARQVLEINNYVRTWADIKKILINNFGDKKTALQIYDEMRAVVFKNNSVDLYNEIQTILRRLNNKVKGEENYDDQIKANIASALEIFKNKVCEPMRSILYSRNPKTLEEAMDILFEGNYAYYNPNKRFNNPDPKSNKFKGKNSNESQKNVQDNSFHNTNNNSFPNNQNRDNRQNPGQYRNKNAENNTNFNRPPKSGNRPNFSNPQPSTSSARNNQEPMDVDGSSNTRIHVSQVQEVENFHLDASGTKFLI